MVSVPTCNAGRYGLERARNAHWRHQIPRGPLEPATEPAPDFSPHGGEAVLPAPPALHADSPAEIDIHFRLYAIRATAALASLVALGTVITTAAGNAASSTTPETFTAVNRTANATN